jgi:hypothetical protein
MDARQQEFGDARLLEEAQRRNGAGSTALVDGIFEVVDAFAQNAEQADDITRIVIARPTLGKKSAGLRLRGARRMISKTHSSKIKAPQPKKLGRPPKKHRVRYRPLKLKVTRRPSEAAIKRAVELAGGREIPNVRSNEAYTPIEIIAALDAVGGIKQRAALEIGCTYKTFRSYITRYPEIAKALDVIRKELNDHAEQVVISELQKGHLRVAVYYTKPSSQDVHFGKREATSVPRIKNQGIDWTSLPPATRKLILDTWRRSLPTRAAAASRKNSSSATATAPTFENSTALTSVPLIVETAASYLRTLPGFAGVSLADRCAVVINLRLAGYVFVVFRNVGGDPHGTIGLVGEDGSPVSPEVLRATLRQVQVSKTRNRWGPEETH